MKEAMMNKDSLEYVTCIIGSLSQMMGLPCDAVYQRLKSANLISYLVGSYDVLHTLSLEYVSEDLIELLNKKGGAKC